MDLYNIPNDNGVDYRLKKFVEYQHEVPSIHYRFLGEYVKTHDFDKDDIINVCFLMALTYNEITCILIYNMIKSGKSMKEIWETYKENLLFGSAKKYVKNNNQFISIWNNWVLETSGQPYYWVISRLCENPVENYRILSKSLTDIKNVGRFSADLFLETAIYLKDLLYINVSEPTNLDWKNCANLTSGIYNIFYKDEKANLFDKSKKISKEDMVWLEKKLSEIQTEIIKTYPEQDAEISKFIGKICSFRNLFKNARYGGFHHDRQLGWLKEYEKNFPEYKSVWEECYSLRKKIFPNRFLGELNGWSGIRKERKKIWLSTGRTGVE